MSRFLLALVLLLLVRAAVRAEEFEPAKTHALIVGVLEWKHGLSGFPKRNRKDQELRDLLVKRGAAAENIELLLDQQATLAAIRKALAKTLERAPADATLIVYYAGHGWAIGGGDYGFANYDVQPGRRETAWRLQELAETLARDFKGRRVLLWADCCYSGGLEIVVDALAARKIAACNLTSAGTANTSTNNWTFTQSIIDGLRGEPLIDRNGDGKITLAELHEEVREAMRHLEGQKHGFKRAALAEDLVLARTRGPAPQGSEQFPAGCYVRVQGRYGRVIECTRDAVTVQFYEYSDKVRRQFEPGDLVRSTRAAGAFGPAVAFAPQSRPADCNVEWRGAWYPARIIKREPGRWFINYVGYGPEWDEWVGRERIQFLAPWYRPWRLDGTRWWQPLVLDP